MILLCGIRSEPPLALVGQALQDLGADFRFVHQRHVARYGMAWRSDAAGVGGVLQLGEETIDLRSVDGVYLRLMETAKLPEIVGLPADDPANLHAQGFHDALFRWAEVAPTRVVNRADPQGSNSSKPYQAQLIAAAGFLPPPTLITNDPAAVLAFRAEHGRIIYKSISAVRSIVKTFEDDDVARLDRIAWCPVQFQAALDGVNIRVHVIDDQVLATQIESSHTDYRYAKQNGGYANLSAIALPADVAARCVTLTRDLGLAFSGIDLMRTPGGEFYCFEVNPQPAYSYFEANTGQPIAATLARFLAYGVAAPPRAAARRSTSTKVPRPSRSSRRPKSGAHKLETEPSR
jgi:glutathione synthase/RimK-type ligase-like ATP-grasp enzyme